MLLNLNLAQRDPIGSMILARQRPRAKILLPADIVANDAKSCHSRVVLHRAAKRILRVFGHGVRLVKDDDLEWRPSEG